MLQNKTRFFRPTWKQLLPWLWLAAAYLAAVAFCVVYGRAYLDSDMASEMVLADLLNQEGGLLSMNWYYSTEIRVVYQQLVFRLGLLLFPENWPAARVFGQAIMLALMAAGYLYFSYGAGAKRSAPWGAGAILLPFGFWQMFLVTFGGSYLPHIIFALFSAGLVLRLAQPAPLWRTGLRLLVLAGIAGVSGLNGVRLLMNLYLPLAVATVVLLVVRVHTEPQALTQLRRPEWRMTLAAFAAAAVSAVGYLLNIKVLAPTHHFTSFEDRYWTDLSLNELLNTWSGFLSLFGYQSDNAVASRNTNQTLPQLFSLRGILCLCGLAMAFAVIAAAVTLLRRWKRLTFGQQVVTALFFSILVVDGMIFALTSGSHGDNCSYWVPVLPFAIALLEAAWATADFHLPATRWCAAVLASLCLLGSSTATVRQYLAEPLRGNPTIQTVCQWLLDNGYTEGYASFWDSNVLTELSSGEIECWTVATVQNMSIYPWLQKTSHTAQPPQGQVFVLIGPDDKVADLSTLPYVAEDGSNIAYRDDAGFTILIFDSADEIYTALDEAWAAEAEAQAETEAGA